MSRWRKPQLHAGANYLFQHNYYLVNIEQTSSA